MKSEKGFSLIEILVALTLSVIMFSLVKSVGTTAHDDIEKALDTVERAVRFSRDEAALRNTLVRVQFDLDKQPVDYLIQYGPGEGFLLPSSEELERIEGLRSDIREKIQKRQKDEQGLFASISEFTDGERTFPDNVKFLGIGLPSQKNLLTEGKQSIYTFASGERDPALLIFATDDEIASLTILPFSLTFDRKYYPLDKIQIAAPTASGDEIESKQQQMAKEIFEEWKSASE